MPSRAISRASTAMLPRPLTTATPIAKPAKVWLTSACATASAIEA
jgi:hypothetical protein